MSDIISAKCFGCGHIVKVPSALGGKKARCPKCTNTIAIPALSETQDDIIGDDQLPEVAKDGEVLEAEEVLEEDPDEAQTASSAARRALGARRPGPREGPASVRAGARGTAPRLVPARRSSNGGLIAGLVIGALVLAGLAVAFSRKPADDRGKPSKGTGTPVSGPGVEAPRTAADAELEERTREFLSAWNKAQIAEAARFYDPEPSAEIKKRVGQMIEGGVQFRNPEIRAASAAAGTVTFVCEYQSSTEAAAAREVTLRWRKDGDSWYIAEGP